MALDLVVLEKQEEAKKMKKITIRTSVAFIIWAVLLSGAFVFTGFKSVAQFGAFAM